MAKDIYIKGANENNLKHIDVTVPRDKMVVPVSYTHLDVYKRQH